MRKAILIFLVMNSLISFAQTLPPGYYYKNDKRVERDKRVYGENYVAKKIYKSNATSYKQQKISINFNKKDLKTTVLVDNKRNLILPGNWSLIDSKKETIKSIISHSYALKNVNNFLFEYSKTDFFRSNKKAIDYFLKITNDIENLSNKNIGELKLIKTDVENNYKMYAKTEFDIDTNSFSDVYYLIGLKNNIIFQIALSNFLKEDFIDMDVVFIQIYLDNI